MAPLTVHAASLLTNLNFRKERGSETDLTVGHPLAVAFTRVAQLCGPQAIKQIWSRNF